MYSKLLFEVIKRIKPVRCIEIFVVFAVGTLDFSVVPRSVRLYQLVPYAILLEASLKQRRCGIFGTPEPLCKLLTIVGLDTLDFEFEGFEHMIEEHCRAV